MKFDVVVLFGLCIALVSASALAKVPPYQLTLPSSEVRESLNGMIEDLRFREKTGLATDQHLNSIQQEDAYRLLRSYRAVGAVVPNPVADAPYFGMILGSKAGEVYSVAYDASYKENYEKMVTNVALETLFDGFLKGVEDHSLPPALAEAADQIGSCLANKSLKGKSPSCYLDPSDAIDEPGFFPLLFTKVFCYLPIPTDCSTRQTIYNAAKSKLVQARHDPAVQKVVEDEFNRRFPEQFRGGFMDELSTEMKNFPKIVSEKFQPAASPSELDLFWGPSTPLVEDSDQVSTRAENVELRDFSQGLRADLTSAALFASSADPEEVSAASALFYAAANRFLVLTGGQKARWDGSHFLVNGGTPSNPGGPVDPAHPKDPPSFVVDTFGGWSATKTAQGVSAGAWDWANYDPSAPNPGFKVFPSIFSFDPLSEIPSFASGASNDPSESLEELSQLAISSLAFLKDTQPQAALGKYFVSTQNFADILDPTKPGVFPEEGRALAVGVLAGILKNLEAPGVGHLETSTTGGSLGVNFYDLVRLSGRDRGASSVQGVSRLIEAASELREMLTTEPAFPPELRNSGALLDQLIQIGALTLGAQGQGQDGGFQSQMGVSTPGAHHLNDCIMGLTALSRAFESSQILVLRLSIKQSWLFLDRFWEQGAIPRLVEGSQGGKINPSTLWQILDLWNHTQGLIKQSLATELDWAKWDNRMNLIRTRLMDQLQTSQGPAPFIELAP